MTESELYAFRTGADFQELCAISRQESDRLRRAKPNGFWRAKRLLQRALREKRITPAEYATQIREAAQRCGI